MEILILCLMAVIVVCLFGKLICRVFGRAPDPVSCQRDASSRAKTARLTMDEDGLIQNPSTFSVKAARPIIASYASVANTSLSNILSKIPAAALGKPISQIYTLCALTLKDKIICVIKDFDTCASTNVDNVLLDHDRKALYYCLREFIIASDMAVRLDQALNFMFQVWSEDSPELATIVEKAVTLEHYLDSIHYKIQSILYALVSKKSGHNSAGVLSSAVHIAFVTPFVEDRAVSVALERMNERLSESYMKLEPELQARLDGYYLPTIALVLDDFIKSEECKVVELQYRDVCLKAIAVVDEILAVHQEEFNRTVKWGLAAEVEALEKLVAMHGDIVGAAPR